MTQIQTIPVFSIYYIAMAHPALAKKPFLGVKKRVLKGFKGLLLVMLLTNMPFEVNMEPPANEEHIMTVKPFLVRAEWDEESSVWVATSDDVRGLVTEAATMEG